MSYKLWSIDSPKYLKGVLPLFRGGTGYTSTELSESTKRIELSGSVRRLMNLTQRWYVLGILKRVKQTDRSYLYKIDEFGEYILSQLDFNPSNALDLMHWASYSAWLRMPRAELGWSWVYQQVCNLIWDDSPNQIIPNALLASALEKANLLFPEDNPSFNIGSIRTVTWWLAALDPPGLHKQKEDDPGSPFVSSKRSNCSPELMHLAIQLQYYTRNLPFKTPLLIEDSTIEDICRVCMLATEQFWPMVELCDLTFPSLQRKETAYGTSLFINEPAEFTPPAPRSVKPDTKQGAS